MFTKFRDVGGGVQWPYNILAERNGEKVFEIFSDSVEINQGLSDNFFTLSGEHESSCLQRSSLLIAQRDDRIESRCLARRPDSEEQTHAD